MDLPDAHGRDARKVAARGGRLPDARPSRLLDGPGRIPDAAAGRIDPPPAGGDEARRALAGLGASLLVGLAVASWPGLPAGAARPALAVAAGAVLLWIAMPVALPVGALLAVVALILSGAATPDLAFSGFASEATLLLIGGMFMARGVEISGLARRVALELAWRAGRRPGGTLQALLLLPQVLAWGVPANAVRSQLMLPVVEAMLERAREPGEPPGSEQARRRQWMLALAFGGNVSNSGLLPAAVGNILTAAILARSLGLHVGYFTWLLGAWPVWLGGLLAAGPVIRWTSPAPEPGPAFLERLGAEVRGLGPLAAAERRALAWIAVAILLWATGSWTGIPLSATALLTGLAMAIPGVGVAPWTEMSRIGWGTILTVAGTIGLGNALTDSGAAAWLAQGLAGSPLGAALGRPGWDVLLLAVLTQLLHLVLSNVSSEVVVLAPLVISLARAHGADPLAWGMVLALSADNGYLLAVQTVSNMVAVTQGRLRQREMGWPGLWMTAANVALVVLTATLWWPRIGIGG
ncbi:MAG: SLC13 family permease [Bacillota bacterium]|nr:SLC13 family permease [Bacillota bacterium]